MKLPHKILAGVITMAAAAGAVGLAGCDNHESSAPQQQTAVTQTVQQTAPVQEQAPVQQAVETPDASNEKQAKLAAMEAYDQQLLLADGYKATARLDYGNGRGNPPTGLLDPGLHYHGTSTCIEYAAVINGPVAPAGFQVGQHVHIYVQHHGVSGDLTHTKFTAQRGPALPAN